MAPHQNQNKNEPAPNTPSFAVLLGINISLSVLKGNYFGNLCHNIITDTRIISPAIYSILRALLAVFMSFQAFKISQTSN
jgi:hypothetical protein